MSKKNQIVHRRKHRRLPVKSCGRRVLQRQPRPRPDLHFKIRDRERSADNRVLAIFRSGGYFVLPAKFRRFRKCRVSAIATVRAGLP